MSEETEAAGEIGASAWPSTWVVDPIDGTRAYIAGRPDWTISVALVADGRPLLAALYAPVSDEMFLAVRGAGATWNGAEMRASSGAALDGARLGGPKRYLERLSHLNPRVQPQPRVHSLALRLARVAQGDAGGRLFLRRQPRLGPCGGRPFGPRSRRRNDRLCRPAAQLQSTAKGAWRADRRRFRPP